MKKVLLLLSTVFVFSYAPAQPDSLARVKEINEQVWKPFVTHFTSGNKEGFRDLHSKRITRVEIDRGILLDYNKYFPAPDPNAPVKKKDNRLFELRFDKRIGNGSMAWEMGYYKGTVLREGKEPWSYYGRFYVLLEKENGTWKILIDADTGVAANEENFNKALPME